MNREQGNQRTILLIEEDEETRPILRHSLVRDGYHVLLALDEADATQRVSDGHITVDLILINLVGKTAEDTLEAGRRIRGHSKYDGHTPLVVLAEKYGKDVEGTDVNVNGNDWIVYLGEELDQLENLLRRLTSEA